MVLARAVVKARLLREARGQVIRTFLTLKRRAAGINRCMIAISVLLGNF